MMTIVTLTQAERDKFIAYLRQEVESNKLMIEQLKKLGPGGEIMIPKMQQDTAAMIIVAQRVIATEGCTIESAQAEAEAEGEK